MTCGECQVQIFESELDRDALVHLTACENCRALEREVCLNAEALASMRADAMPTKARPTSRPWHWGVAVAAAAVAAFLLSYQATYTYTGPAATAIVTKLPEPELNVPAITGNPGFLVPAAPAILMASLPAPKMQLPPPPAEPRQDMLVQMFTDDPDVVIYWLVDSKRGEGI